MAAIFLNGIVRITIKISLKFVYKDQINNIPALVQIMAWRQPGDMSLSGPNMVGLPTRICVMGPQLVNLFNEDRCRPKVWMDLLFFDN